MERAADAVVAQEAAGRDHLGFDRVVAAALDLAEIRRLPGENEGLQSPLFPRTHDLDLQVPTARRFTLMIGGGAWGGGTGIRSRRAIQDRERAGRKTQPSRRGLTVVDYQKTIAAQPAGLLHARI